jgi:hypothetical protein
MAIFIPQPRDEAEETLVAIRRQIELAAEEGLTPIDLLDAYSGHPHAQIRLAPWDGHPNVLGHQLLADGFHAGIRSILPPESLPTLPDGGRAP